MLKGDGSYLLGEAASKSSAAFFADGYHLAMFVGAGLAFVGAAISLLAKPAAKAPG